MLFPNKGLQVSGWGNFCEQLTSFRILNDFIDNDLRGLFGGKVHNIVTSCNHLIILLDDFHVFSVSCATSYVPSSASSGLKIN